MPDPSIVYAVDEDIRVRCPGDWDELAPLDQVLASGEDGVINAASPWLLTSASTQWSSLGLAKGNVIGLTFDVGEPRHFAVDSVSGAGVVLRRLGMKSSGQGQPPVTADTAAIGFEVRTFAPQIEDAAYDLNRRYGINDDFPNQAAAYLYDPRELRQATVLTVLKRQYANENRAKDGDFAAKAMMFAAELDETLARLSVHFGKLGQASEPINRFSMQYRR